MRRSLPRSLGRVLLALVAWAASVSLRAQDDSAAAHRAAIQSFYPVMIAAVEAGNFAQARNLCEQAILWEPQDPVHWYNLACIEARSGGAHLPAALAALEQAIQLGFNDADALRNDPDLAAIRGEPKFAELLQRVPGPAGPPAALRPNAPPVEREPAASVARRAAPQPAAAVVAPAPAKVKAGVPVGLYFMTRYWPFNGMLEKSAWYFGPDGTVYEKLEHGFSTEDLAAHQGRKGRSRSEGNRLEITWADGKKSSSQFEASKSGTGFTWDMGIFTPAQAFGKTAEAAGVYEGGESLSGGGNRVAVSKRLELRADGTFTWSGVSFVGTTSQTSQMSAGAVNAGSTGTWRVDGYSLLLTDDKGNVFRRIAFPVDDEDTPLKSDRMFFGGLLYKKQP